MREPSRKFYHLALTFKKRVVAHLHIQIGVDSAEMSQQQGSHRVPSKNGTLVHDVDLGIKAWRDISYKLSQG